MKPWAAGLFCCTTVALIAQTLTPREVFYAEAKPAAVKPAARPHKPAAAPAHTQPAADSAVVTAHPASASGAGRLPAASATADVTFQTVSSRPLGLKYSVMKRDASGNYDEVDPDARFVANDQIRLTVESNDAGYLYVVMKGSSGKWEVLFPSTKAPGSNRAERGASYSIPPGHVFTFDEKSGTEKLFVILSREPETDLEGLTYSLQERKPAKSQMSAPLVAQNYMPVQDEMVQRMRNTYSRDLLIEKVDDSKTPPSGAEKEIVTNLKKPSGEKAVYVVNPSGAPNARVVADIALRHE